MDKSKNILLIILSTLTIILMVLYLGFLFVLPSSIDLNQYTTRIQKKIKDATSFQVQLEGVRLKTAWNLSVGVTIDKIDLKDPLGEKIAQFDNLQVSMSLLPMIFGKFNINKIDLDKILLDLNTKSNGELMLKSYLKNTIKKKNRISSVFLKIKHSKTMPDIYVKTYRVSLLNKSDKYSIKGSDLRVTNFILNEKIKFKTQGAVILNNRKQLSYNISIFSKLSSKKPKLRIKMPKLIIFLHDLYKYDVRAKINSDLKIHNNIENYHIDGNININKILFTFEGKTVPKSDLNINFKKNIVKLNSNFYTGVRSKAVITGRFKSGKHKKVKIKVQSDNIDIKSVIFILKPIVKVLGFKNMDAIIAKGSAKADFSLKSDFKKIQSSGYLKIKNAKIIDKLYNLSLSSINADIDFTKDNIKIKKATANLNNQPIKIAGNIDKNAMANILIFAKKLSLKSVLLASDNTEVVEENDILNGSTSINCILKGRLDKITPHIIMIINNVNLKNKKTKTQIKLAKATINLSKWKKTKNQGKIQLLNLKIIPNSLITISVPKINMQLNNDRLNIEKSNLYINNIKMNLVGKIFNLTSSPRLHSINIKTSNQVTTTLTGYKGSKINIDENIIINGDLSEPKIEGYIRMPSVVIPTIPLSIQNLTLNFNKDITITCPRIQIADSVMGGIAQIDKNSNAVDISKKIVVKNINLTADNINLNTLINILKTSPKNSNPNFTILNGNAIIKNLEIGRINSSNLTSKLTFKNNVLHLMNFKGEAYLGQIAGKINYNIAKKKINLNLQGRKLSIAPALLALTGGNNDITGRIDFDSNLLMVGHSKDELLKNINGKLKFIISNGEMGVLGKFEHLLYAQNVVSNSVFKSTLNGVAKAITVKNTGMYKYMKGYISLSHGWANINWIKTSGPSMSLYITGRFYLPSNVANLVILGKISNDVVNILGPIGEFSMDKIISYIPKLGKITSFFASQFITSQTYENTSMIPYLSPKTDLPTKEFKVVIDGIPKKQRSVKSFKWITKSKKNLKKDDRNKSTIHQDEELSNLPDFIKDLPDLNN